MISIDAAGNVVIKRPRKDSVLGTFGGLGEDGDSRSECQSDFENPYPEMATNRQEKLNRSCPNAPSLEISEQDLNVSVRSQSEAEEEKEKEEPAPIKKTPEKRKGKKGAKHQTKAKSKSKGTSYSSYKTSVPVTQRSGQKSQPQSQPQAEKEGKKETCGNTSGGSASGLKRKLMNVTPSVPELARTEPPELMKERVVLVKDSRSGEYCKNKIVLKLVSTEEWEGTPSKDRSAPKAEETKMPILAVVQSEVVEKIPTFIYTESPLQIETSSPELLKWVESKEATSLCWCKMCESGMPNESDEVMDHLASHKHIEMKKNVDKKDAFASNLLRISVVPASDNSATELLNEKAKLLKKKAKKIKQVRLSPSRITK